MYYSETRLKEIKDFWFFNKNWPPVDPKGYTYLARAIIYMGRELVDSNWSGPDHWDGSILSLPKFQTKIIYPYLHSIKIVRESLYCNEFFNVDHNNSINDLKEKYKIPQDDQQDFLDHLEYSLGEESVDLSDFFSDELWSTMVKHSDELSKKRYKSLNDWRYISIFIAKCILHEDVTYRLYDIESGQFINGRIEPWISSKWEQQLETCHQIVGAEYGHGRPWNIFLNTSELETAIAAIKKQPQLESNAWKPRVGEACKAWCGKDEVQLEGKRRAKLTFGNNPQQRQIATAMATMWNECKDAKLKPRTIEQYIIAQRNSNRD